VEIENVTFPFSRSFSMRRIWAFFCVWRDGAWASRRQGIAL